LANIVLSLPDLTTNGCERPYSRDTGSSTTANKKFGSSREPAQVCSPKAQTGRHGYVVDLACVECPDMNTAKICICDLFAVV